MATDKNNLEEKVDRDRPLGTPVAVRNSILPSVAFYILIATISTAYCSNSHPSIDNSSQIYRSR